MCCYGKLVVTPPVVQICQVEILMAILVGQFRLLYMDQVVEIWFMQHQVAKYQVMVVEVLVSVLELGWSS